MRRVIWIGGLALVVALGALAGVGLRGRAAPPVARSPETFEVLAGTDVTAQAAMAIAFLPNAITVAAGDTVRWRFGGFHTVTFLAGNPVLALLLPGPGPGERMGGPGFFPIPRSPEPTSGPYDGTTLLSTGTPQGTPTSEPPLSLTFTHAGVYGYLCTVHHGMAGQVTVLAAGAALPESPAQVAARGQSQLSAIQGAIAEAAAAVQSARASTRGDVSVATVDVGLATAVGGSKLAFLPDDLRVRRGDVVTFMSSDTHNPHTVTFTAGGRPPAFGTTVFTPNGPPLVVFRANVASLTGGTTYGGQDYANSGILDGGQAFALTIDAPAGTYEYLCLVHGTETSGMRGRITVTD